MKKPSLVFIIKSISRLFKISNNELNFTNFDYFFLKFRIEQKNFPGA